MLSEHDSVVLIAPDPENGLEAGDVGAIVHVYPNSEAYEIEFVTFSGQTAAVVTVAAQNVRAVAPTEIPHARELATS